MSLLFNALSGAQAAQAALGTSSQNIANVMTPGYSRQGVVLTSVGGNASSASAAGGGVTVSSLKRFSDGFKNLQMWQAASNLGKADASQPYLDQLEQVMSDDTSNVNAGMDQFFAALNAASVEPDSTPLRAQVLTAADGLAKRFSSLQQLLQNQQSAVAAQRDAVVTQINTLSASIAELNKQIGANKAVGIDPSGLQDTRDQNIDALAALVGVQVVNQADGTTNVSLKSGQPLVVGGDAASLAVNNLSNGTHSLSLKFANTSFTVLGTDFGGQLGGLENFESQTLVPLQTTVREMATGIANAFNAQLAQGADPTQTPVTLGTGKPLFVDPATNGGQLQLAGISPAELAFSLDPTAAGDSQNLTKLIALQGKPITLTTFDSNGKPLPTSSQVVLGDAYTQLIGKLGVASQQNIAAQKTAQTVRDQAEESWKSTSGVNQDEEAVNLVQFQQMYQANMKVIAVANQLFDSTLEIM
ncbi:flagellar hook-associated protein FlgK [Paucibacter sp. R3-3]|uniref:Flagellar hook-associated protein 1 n=1 Tax=Roseateles agri TaxID=3098619 RepID=A0ABU5DM78_9BURK|nr:flagellar hook-associated protein FlgK [Paucibacter sp. R3-3]MDY0747412.1 flagellar hook-associated protein FlgK [Paucibacter sp. R3-3]